MFFVIISDDFDVIISKTSGVTTGSRKTTVFRELEKCYGMKTHGGGNTYCGYTFTNGPSLHECWGTPL